jgi:hypothetical protein
MKQILAILILLMASAITKAEAPQLSPSAEISILTCSPGEELYSLFGHSAIRVYDPEKKLDVVFNYGTFSFNEDFYFNFAMGRLLYSLSIGSMDRFLAAYQSEQRGVTEQVLLLNQEQKQKVVDYLDWNYQPENREYLYDFFYDNCSSRLRLVLEKSLPESKIDFVDLQAPEQPSFRNMIDRYLVFHPWGDFGIDLGLGLPCDKIPTSDEYVFLPHELETAFDHAKIDGVPLVKRKSSLLEATPLQANWSWFNPIPLMWTLLGLVIVLTTLGWRFKQLYWGLDVFLFLVIGSVGLLVTFLWFVTDHNATVNNLNILWAWPTHLLAIALLPFKQLRSKYLILYGIISFATLLLFPFLPQDLHQAVVPILLIGITRGLLYWRVDRV